MAVANKTKGAKSNFDAKKESIFRQLSEIIKSKGFFVRRESLKSGIGWRVFSGTCEYAEQQFIFIDKRLSQDDQIDFMVGKALELGLKLTEEEKNNLPKSIQHLFE